MRLLFYTFYSILKITYPAWHYKLFAEAQRQRRSDGAVFLRGSAGGIKADNAANRFTAAVLWLYPALRTAPPAIAQEILPPAC